MKKISISILVLFTGLFFLLLLNSNKGKVHNYKIFSMNIPKNINFANEKVPLNDPDVKERLDRELLVNTYWHSNTILCIKRAQRIFPIIEPILKEYGVPDDFKYLAVIESNLERKATSYAGAKGVWQIMRGTGREYGLEINSYVDERMNIEISTRLACQYLKKGKEKLGDWTLSAVAYNAGMNGINRKMKGQNTKSFYGLVLKEEPSRYVFRILAMKEIFNNPTKYGFNIKKDHLYEPLDTKSILIDYQINDISKWSNRLGYSYKTVKYLNPWLLTNKLINKSKKEYCIKLPEDKKLFN